MVARQKWCFELLSILLSFYYFFDGMAYSNVKERRTRSRSLADLRGGFRRSDKYIRSDYNFYAVLRDALPEEKGANHMALILNGVVRWLTCTRYKIQATRNFI